MLRRCATRSSSLHLYRIGQLTPTSGPAASKYCQTRRSIRGGRKGVWISATPGRRPGHPRLRPAAAHHPSPDSTRNSRPDSHHVRAPYDSGSFERKLLTLLRREISIETCLVTVARASGQSRKIRSEERRVW